MERHEPDDELRALIDDLLRRYEQQLFNSRNPFDRNCVLLETSVWLVVAAAERAYGRGYAGTYYFMRSREFLQQLLDINRALRRDEES